MRSYDRDPNIHTMRMFKCHETKRVYTIIIKKAIYRDELLGGPCVRIVSSPAIKRVTELKVMLKIRRVRRSEGNDKITAIDSTEMPQSRRCSRTKSVH